MALVAPPANDRKRVKVYELKNNDWFDRGTGFCKGMVLSVCLLLHLFIRAQTLRLRNGIMACDCRTELG